MEEHYMLALASQPVGQVLLQQADRAFLHVQRSLEASDPAGDLETADSSSVVEDKVESLPRWPLSSAAYLLLEKAGYAGANLRSKFLKSVDPETTSKVANFFKERRETIETLKLEGLKHMEENSKVVLGNHKVARLLLWPLASVISLANSIARPYVSPAAERIIVKVEEVSQDEPGSSPDDSVASWRTSTDELADAEKLNEEEEVAVSSPSSAEEAAAAEIAAVNTAHKDTLAETENRKLFDVFHFKAKAVDKNVQ